ncbi:chemotaxis response regulator protein-glutamate methylesterase [Chromobacterium sp.]|uniref:protein-glutamate methylesterase/protein-glutamine glutaminase n=1 Tax=Chromobacterium sp. TaxID=306190 RepID=UPI0035AE689E
MSIAVLIVDDSAVAREMLGQMLATAPDIKVLAASPDPLYAMKRMKIRWPDVIILDLAMPRMDGLTFLRQVMAERPTPVIICSALTTEGAAVSLEAMSAGAVSVLLKPLLNARTQFHDNAKRLVDEVRAAARVKVEALKQVAASCYPAPRLDADAILAPPPELKKPAPGSERIIAVGASTGGTQALEFLVQRLPPYGPGMVVVQHMPEGFTAIFAGRLNQLAQVEVREARDGDVVGPGTVLIAPGGRHLLVQRRQKRYFVEIKGGPPVSRHRPSVDVLFRSVAVSAGSSGVGLILTGMGDDGARGMREMHDAGARTLAQDESSCVVFGMPQAAIARGGVGEVMSLEQMAWMLQGLRA